MIPVESTDGGKGDGAGGGGSQLSVLSGQSGSLRASYPEFAPLKNWYRNEPDIEPDTQNHDKMYCLSYNDDNGDVVKQHFTLKELKTGFYGKYGQPIDMSKYFKFEVGPPSAFSTLEVRKMNNTPFSFVKKGCGNINCKDSHTNNKCKQDLLVFL
jgi:hypothetical protein